MNEYSFSYTPMLDTQPMSPSFSYGRPWLPKSYSFKYGRLSTVNDADYMSSPEAFKKTASGLFFSTPYLQWLGGPYMSMMSKSEGFGISDDKRSMHDENSGISVDDNGREVDKLYTEIWLTPSKGNRKMLIWKSVGEFLFNDYSHYGSYLSNNELASSYFSKQTNDGNYTGLKSRGIEGNAFEHYLGYQDKDTTNIYEALLSWKEDPRTNINKLESLSSKNSYSHSSMSIFDQLSLGQQMWYDLGNIENLMTHKTVPKIDITMSSEHIWKVPFKTSPGPDVLTPWKKSFQTSLQDTFSTEKFFQYWSIYENITISPPDATRHLIWNKEPDIMAYRPIPRLLIMQYENIFKYNAKTNWYDNYMASKPAANILDNPILNVLRSNIYVWVNDLYAVKPPDKIPYLMDPIFGFKYDYEMTFADNFEAMSRDKYGILISNERIAEAFKDKYKLSGESGIIIHKINRKLIWDSHPWTLKYGSDRAFEYGNNLITKPTVSVIENIGDNAGKDRIKAFFLGYDETHKVSGDVGSVNETLFAERIIYQITQINTEHASVKTRSIITKNEIYAFKDDINANIYDYVLTNKDSNIVNGLWTYQDEAIKSDKIITDNSVYYDAVSRTVPKIWFQKTDSVQRHKPDTTLYTSDMAYRRNPHVNWYKTMPLSYKSKMVVNAPLYMLFGQRHINEIYRFINAFEEVSKSEYITNELSPFKMAARPIVNAWPYDSVIASKKYKPTIENGDDWAWVPNRNVLCNLQKMALRPIREVYDNMWSSVFVTASGSHELIKKIFENSIFDITKYPHDIYENGIIDITKSHKNITEDFIGAWEHKTVPNVFTTDMENIWKHYANIMESYNGAYTYKVNRDVHDLGIYCGFISKRITDVLVDKYDEFVLKDYLSVSDFKTESCVFIYKKFTHVIIPDSNGVFVYRSKGENTTLGEFIHDWVKKLDKNAYGGISGEFAYKIHKDVMDKYIGVFASKSQIYSTGMLNGISIFKMPTDTYAPNNGLFVSKPAIDTAIYNEEHAQALKVVRDVMLERYFTSVTKPSINVSLHDDTFVYKMLYDLALFSIESVYKKVASAFTVTQESAHKVSYDMYANTSVPLWGYKAPSEVFTKWQEWVDKNARRLQLESNGVFASATPKPVRLTDKEITSLVKDKIDIALWQKVQGHDFVAIYKGAKDVHTQDDDIFVIDKARDILVQRQCFASVLGKSISLFDNFNIFCDKDGHEVFLQAENVWCLKSKKSVMSDIIGAWLIDGKRSIITDIELKFASKGKKQIIVNPSVHARKNKKPFAIDPFQSWVNKIPKVMSLFNKLEWGNKYKRFALFSQETVWKDKKSMTLFIQEWLGKTYKDTFVNDAQDFFNKRIEGFTNAGEFVKRMNSFKVRTEEIDWFDTNKIASIITVEREADGFNEKFLIPVEKLSHNALYQEIDSMIKKYRELHLDKDDFGAWAWVYEYPESPFDDPYEKGGIDELLLPEKDTKYENFEDIIFNKKLNRPRNPVKKIDDNTWICKFPTKHPFKNFHEEDGNHYVGVVDGNYFGVDVGIMQKIYLKYYQIWQQNIFRFATMTMIDASKLMLEYLYSWITLYFPSEDIDQALRIFRQVRWFSESAVINNSQYIVSGEWEDMKMLDIPNNLTDNDTMYYDPKTVTIRNSPDSLEDEAYVEFYIDAWKNTVFSFSIVNTVGNVKVFIDDKRVDVISKTRRINKYPITYTGETTVVRIEKDAESNINTMFMLANIRVEGLKFGTLNVDFDPKLKAGNKPLSEVADKMMRFANLYDDANAAYEEALKSNIGISVTVDMMKQYFELHHKDKNKGKRLCIKKT